MKEPQKGSCHEHAPADKHIALSLDAMHGQVDALVRRMQEPKALKAAASIGDADPRELGQAVTGADQSVQGKVIERMEPGPPMITVLAGTNGAGKSSVLGNFIRAKGGEYFNPDEVARQLRTQLTALSQSEANGLAWKLGYERLNDAIKTGINFAFETTLGGRSIPSTLSRAASLGHRVTIWYMGLNSPELHVQRVAERVRRGGHAIPEAKIRERFTRSVENFVSLLPVIHECRVFDNSQTAEIERGESPNLDSVLHLRGHNLMSIIDLNVAPAWAMPIIAASHV